MGRFALSWVIDDALHAVDLDTRAESTLGRASEATIRLDLPTVSRHQAVLRPDGTRILVENLSTTSATTVDDRPITGPTPLADGARLQASTVAMRFHDLAIADRLSGPVCSNCGRENPSPTGDCWFCGTSLVNAPTQLRTRRRVRCRLVDAAGGATNLYDEQVLIGDPSGALQAHPADLKDGSTGPLAVSVAAQGVVLGPGASRDQAGGVEQAAGVGDTLRTGDVIRVGSRRFVAIVR
jgi:FHA domain